MAWGDEAAVWRVTLELPDGRWWRAEILANSPGEAKLVARRAADLPAARVLLCDRVQGVEARVLAQWVEEPRGWEAS